MVVTKKMSKSYEVDVWPIESWSTPMSEFIASRRTNGMSVKQFEHCFCCGRSLRAEEVPRIRTVHGIGNRFLCNTCAEKEDQV